ncbi:uncharacterized protein LOC119669829 isoform X3 [Teleopsis dalmanni]|nr:uncharacterized protein LOC119669829 isoform X2 [Teleopsis dalmanni]XP_037935787.1 uncharacterized protein LOC119669829 isoform X3 [Teleopsis dalmanni]
MPESKGKSHPVMKSVPKNETKVDDTSLKYSVRERAKMFENLLDQNTSPKDFKCSCQHSKKVIYNDIKKNSNKSAILNQKSEPSRFPLSERLRFFNELGKDVKYQSSNVPMYSSGGTDIKGIKFDTNKSYVQQSTPLEVSKFKSKNAITVIPKVGKKDSTRANTTIVDKKSFDLALRCKRSKTGLTNASRTPLSLIMPNEMPSSHVSSVLKLKSQSNSSLYFSDAQKHNSNENVFPSKINTRSGSNDFIKKPIEKIKPHTIGNNVRYKEEQLTKGFNQFLKHKNTFAGNTKSTSYNVDRFDNINVRQKIESFNHLYKSPSPVLLVSNNNVFCVNCQKQAQIVDERYAKYFGIKPSNVGRKNQTQTSQLKKIVGQDDQFKRVNSAYSNKSVDSYVTAQGSIMSSKSLAKQKTVSNFQTASSVCKKNKFQKSPAVIYDDLKPITTFDQIIITKEELLSAEADFDRLFHFEI